MNAAQLDDLREGFQHVAVALKESGRPFAPAGGYAAWVHGSPEPLHDVDSLVREEDVAVILEGLGWAGSPGRASGTGLAGQGADR